MVYGIVKTEELSDIADAIRAKLGVQTTYKPSQMADAIESISGGGITPTGTKSITANGTYDVTSFANAEVNVPQSGITPTGTKQVSVAQNGTTTEDVTNYANVEINTNVVNADYENALTALGVQSDLANSITALTTYANGVTGAADTDLSDAVHTLGSGYGQGGSSLIKLETIDVSENTRSISVVPQSNWFDYDFLIVKYDLTLSASDWLYASTTNLNTSGEYSVGQASAYKYVGAVELNASDESCAFIMPHFVANKSKIDVSSGQTLYLFTYSASKTILSGSSVTIYGGNMSDLL